MVKVDTILKLHLLMALSDGPKHGYELMKETQAALERRVSASNIYPFLQELKKQRYVSFTKNKREKIYSLTASGKKFVEETLTKFHEAIKNSLRKKLTKCAHCGCIVYDNEHNETINGRKMAFCCCHCADSYKKGKHDKKH